MEPLFFASATIFSIDSTAILFSSFKNLITETDAGKDPRPSCCRFCKFYKTKKLSSPAVKARDESFIFFRGSTLVGWQNILPALSCMLLLQNALHRIVLPFSTKQRLSESPPRVLLFFIATMNLELILAHPASTVKRVLQFFRNCGRGCGFIFFQEFSCNACEDMLYCFRCL